MSRRTRKVLIIAFLYSLYPVIAAIGYLVSPTGVERTALAHDFLRIWLDLSLCITSGGLACALGSRLRTINVWATAAVLVVAVGVTATYLWHPWPSDYLLCIAVFAVCGLAAALVVPQFSGD